MDRETRSTHSITILLCVGMLSGWLPSAGAAVAESRLITWAPWEVDSALTAWVLRRHVWPQAIAETVARDSRISDGVMIDTPGANYRRSGTRTAFEAALRLHKIKTPCSDALRPIVRVLELAPWRKSEHADAEEFEAGFRPLLPRETRAGGLDAAFAYVDAYCRKLEKKHP